MNYFCCYAFIESKFIFGFNIVEEKPHLITCPLLTQNKVLWVFKVVQLLPKFEEYVKLFLKFFYNL